MAPLTPAKRSKRYHAKKKTVQSIEKKKHKKKCKTCRVKFSGEALKRMKRIIAIRVKNYLSI